jgi:alkylation response protein AidB-like acyl-CoA dehydrogenase
VFGLFRTDPDAARHSGMTYLMVPLDAPGVTVRGVERLDGDEGFAEVFFDDVFVSDDLVLGGVNNGWAVAMATASSERGLTLRSPGRFCAAADRLVELHRRLAATGEHPERVASLREAVAQAWMEAEAYRLATLADVSGLVEGRPQGARSSLTKIYWSELDVNLNETALRLLGPSAELIEGSADAVDDGVWMKAFEFSLSGPIYAGTNEIQRNVVAERVLGLPRK